MSLRFIQYRVKPEKFEENQLLIEKVFRELAETAPADVRYLVFSLADGTFCHLVDDGSNVIQNLRAFAAFRDNGEERRLTPPQQNAASVVGTYRMIASG